MLHDEDTPDNDSGTTFSNPSHLPSAPEDKLLIGFWVLVKFQLRNTHLTYAFDNIFLWVTDFLPVHAHSCVLKHNIVNAKIWTRFKVWFLIVHIFPDSCMLLLVCNPNAYKLHAGQAHFWVKFSN